MAKIRSISPNACESHRLGAITDPAERLYWRLQTHCDDQGRAVDDPRVIWGACCIQIAGWDDQLVDELLAELHDVGLIHRYQVDGRRYLEVTQFTRFQHPKRPVASKLPPIPLDGHAVPSASRIPTPGGEIPFSSTGEVPSSPPQPCGQPDVPPSDPCGEPNPPDNTEQERNDTTGTTTPTRHPQGPAVFPQEKEVEMEKEVERELFEPNPNLTAKAPSTSPGPGQPAGRHQLVAAAIQHLADHEQAASPPARDPARYRRGIVTRLTRERTPELHALAHTHPHLTADQLARAANGDLTGITTPAAQSRILNLVDRLPTTHQCHTCLGRHQIVDDHGTAHSCPTCTTQNPEPA